MYDVADRYAVANKKLAVSESKEMEDSFQIWLIVSAFGDDSVNSVCLIMYIVLPNPSQSHRSPPSSYEKICFHITLRGIFTQSSSDRQSAPRPVEDNSRQCLSCVPAGCGSPISDSLPSTLSFQRPVQAKAGQGSSATSAYLEGSDSAPMFPIWVNVEAAQCKSQSAHLYSCEHCCLCVPGTGELGRPGRTQRVYVNTLQLRAARSWSVHYIRVSTFLYSYDRVRSDSAGEQPFPTPRRGFISHCAAVTWV